MGRRVQKKIKYWKTPLEPVWDDFANMWVIKFESKKGKIPAQLNGHYTAKHLAQQSIDMFLQKHQVEYID